MKPAPFEYVAPTTVAEACDMLASHGDDAKVLAGGQSLVPLLAFRLVRPALLVDVNGVSGLAGTWARANRVAIGALVRHRDLERTTVPGPTGSLLTRTASLIGHYPIRVRGTFGGSLAHADPAAEWPAVALALDANMILARSDGERTVPAAGFFTGPFTTALRPDELLTRIEVDALGGDWRAGVHEFSRQAGNFALVAVVAAARMAEGSIAEARVVVAGVAGTPVRATAAEAVVAGHVPGDRLFHEAGEAGAAALGEPLADIHATARLRRELTRALITRALRDAFADSTSDAA